MKTHATILALSILTAASAVAQDAEKITYQDHIRPLLENKCFSCHNPDKKKGDLDLTSFGALMTGGGGGAIVEAGNSDASRIWTTCAKKEEPFMPPEGAPLNAKELELLAKWISGGVLDTKSSVAKKSSKPKVDMTVAVTSGKPEGPIAKPEHVLLEPVVVTPRTTAVTAMAASPWTSLVAVAAPKQILLYDTDTKQLAGIFPYTEGYARSLRFSRNGSLLVMGGGRGGKLGHAIVWDVKSGKRIVEVGKEFDQVMSADISPDQKKVVIGSPSKKVKVYDTATGEELYMISKHTEWIMGTAFSPDGVLLATADRNGNVMVWEAENGGEFYILGQHKASCSDLAWRADSNILASSSLDGTISLWEMNEGKQVKNWSAHNGGVQSVSFTPDGKVVSCGNDGITRTWNLEGKELLKTESQGDIVTKVVALHDSKQALTGNWRGELFFYDLATAKKSGQITSNPPLIAQRIIEAEKQATELVAKTPELEGRIQKAREGVTGAEAKLAETKKKAAEALTYKSKLEGETNGIPGKVAELDKQSKDLQAKRQAQIEAIKKYEQTVAAVKKIESELSTLNLEKAKLTTPEQAPKLAEVTKTITEKAAQLENLKKTVAALPQPPVAEFDKQIKAAQDQIAALNNGKAPKTKELEGVKKGLEGWPKTIAENEKQIADAKASLVAAQTDFDSHKTAIAFLQKLPTILKAAQFNVGVLTEKEKLAKLEGDLNDYIAAKKENEEAKVANAGRIDSSKKIIAEATNLIPQHEATLNKLKAELGGLEQAVTPTKTADSAASAKLEDHKKTLAAREAELAALTKARDEGIAAAKKSVEDITKAIDPLKKKQAEVAAKLKGPEEQVVSKKANVTKIEGNLAAVKKSAADLGAALPAQEKAVKDAEAALPKFTAEIQTADKTLADFRKSTADAGRAVQPARQALAKAEKDLADAKAKNAATPAHEQAITDAKAKLAAAEKQAADAAMQLSEAQRAFDTRREARTNAEKTLAEVRKVASKTKNDLANAKNAVTQAEKQLTQAKSDMAAAEKSAVPLRGQQESITKEIAAQEKARADKQAVPAALEAEFATKAKPVSGAIAQLKAAQPPLEKGFAEARAKLEAEIKIVEAKKAEVAKATETFEAAKKQKADAEAVIAAAEKDNPVRDKNLAEINAELTKMQPQLEPQRTKVKQMETQYLTLLPK